MASRRTPSSPLSRSDSLISWDLGEGFQICNVVGRGSFGVVCTALDVRTNKVVAVKRVEINDSDAQRLSQREHSIWEDIKHKNIVQLIEHIPHDTGLLEYFVMEFCSRGNLEKFIEHKSIDLHVCLGYMMDVLEGLGFMHARNIGHRDLKPANVLVTHDQCLQLADFGLVREFGGSSTGNTATGGVGSRNWMAPEIATSKREMLKYGLAVDIFSLGLLFLSVLTHQSGERLTAHEGMQCFVIDDTI